eukprot:scaffold21984_cov151-Isochrysis_galbana.AAC.1
MGSRAGCVSIEWATEGVLESLALSGSDDVLTVLWLPVQLWFLSGGRACAHAFAWLLVSGAREYPQAPLDVAERETPERGGFREGCAVCVRRRCLHIPSRWVLGCCAASWRGPNARHNSASAWRVAMAPRQLLLELEEVDSAAVKGPKRVRADSTNEGSTQ